VKKQKISAMMIAIAFVGLPVVFSGSIANAATSSGASDESGEDNSFESADHDGQDNGDHHQYGDHGQTNHHGVIPPVVIRPHEDGDDYGFDDGDADNNGVPDDNIGGGVLPPIPGGLPHPGPSATPTPGATLAPSATGASRASTNFVVAPLGVGSNAVSGQATSSTPRKVSAIDPQASPAIELAGVKTSSKTPADIFMESATLGISAMAVGALAFGGVASVRAIRARKNPLADYFYDSDN